MAIVNRLPVEDKSKIVLTYPNLFKEIKKKMPNSLLWFIVYGEGLSKFPLLLIYFWVKRLSLVDLRAVGKS